MVVECSFPIYAIAIIGALMTNVGVWLSNSPSLINKIHTTNAYRNIGRYIVLPTLCSVIFAIISGITCGVNIVPDIMSAIALISAVTSVSILLFLMFITTYLVYKIC